MAAATVTKADLEALQKDHAELKGILGEIIEKSKQSGSRAGKPEDLLLAT